LIVAIEFGIPLEDYHSSRLVTHSKITDFARGGPRYFAARYLQRSQPREPSSAAQLVGQALEDRIQLPKRYAELYVAKPDGMTFATKEGKAWRAETQAAGKVVLDGDDMNMIEELVTAIFENDAARELVQNASIQPTISAEFAGLPGIQSRPDWFSPTGCALTGFRPYCLDLKSTLTLAKLTSGRAIVEYGYHKQFGLCAETLRRNGAEDAPVYLLAAEKVRPHRAQIVQLDDSWLEAGWEWCERQLTKLATHYQSGEWPRVESEMVLSVAPSWIRERDNDTDEEAA
jgi:hypothetical protein